MKVLITGANGMVARAVAAHCSMIGDEVHAMTRADLDISRREKVFEVLGVVRPDAVINCAAYTDVDGAESNEEAAYAANAEGPENLAASTLEFGTALVTISTDYVFNGTKEGFYTEADPPDPQSTYARSKYEGELRSAAANPSSVIVRSGWIYGHRGTNFLSVLPDLVRRGQRFKAIDDSFGTPTFADDLAVRLRELAGMKAAGIHHATNSGDGTSYYDFALAVVEAMKADPQLIDGVSDAEMKRPAARPRNSRLRSERSSDLGLLPLRDWQDALTDYLKEKGGK